MVRGLRSAAPHAVTCGLWRCRTVPPPPPIRLHRGLHTLPNDHLAALCEAQADGLRAGPDAPPDPALDLGADNIAKYVMNMVRSMTDAGVIPYLVFDGNCLPAKKATEVAREG